MSNSPEMSASINGKVKNELTNFIFHNLFITIPLLAAVASILVFKLNGHINTRYLVGWLATFLTVTACQGLLVMWFNKTKGSLKWENLYFKLLIADVGLIGALWGTAGVLFMPPDTLGQSYLIFILAFVAAGGALYLARSSLAASVYATGVLVPLAASMITSFFSQPHHEVYFNVTLGLGCYWAFLLTVSHYGSKLFTENFTYSLINKALSEDLSQTTEELNKIYANSRAAREQLLLAPVENIDIQKTLNYKMEHTDELTGADTREIMEVKFLYSRAYARRHHHSLSMLIININDYSEVKAQYGEEISNLLLKTVAIRLLYCKRDTDILSRIDKSKFALVISEVLFGAEIMTVINKIFKTFAEKTIINDNKVHINASIGISIYPKDGEELTDLIQHSEMALSYLAKIEDPQKPQYQFYDAEKMTTKNITTSATNNT